MIDRPFERLKPIGFWSYARQDDAMSNGRLSWLRYQLAQEIQLIYGKKPIRIFQDNEAIRPGAEWEKTIEEAINQSAFFIPILTPAFLESEWCCREVRKFLIREAEIREAHPEIASRRRIFPILYISTRHAEPFDPGVVAELASLQHSDFTMLRREGNDSAAARNALIALAEEVADLLASKVRRAPTTEELAAEGACQEQLEIQRKIMAVAAAPVREEPAERVEQDDVRPAGAGGAMLEEARLIAPARAEAANEQRTVEQLLSETAVEQVPSEFEVSGGETVAKEADARGTTEASGRNEQLRSSFERVTDSLAAAVAFFRARRDLSILVFVAATPILLLFLTLPDLLFRGDNASDTTKQSEPVIDGEEPPVAPAHRARDFSGLWKLRDDDRNCSAITSDELLNVRFKGDRIYINGGAGMIVDVPDSEGWYAIDGALWRITNSVLQVKASHSGDLVTEFAACE